MCSIDTGHACTHAPQVTQSQTASGSTAVVTPSGGWQDLRPASGTAHWESAQDRTETPPAEESP